MRKKILFALALVLIQTTWAFAGDPVMVIRCGIVAFGEEASCGPGFVAYEGHCFPLTIVQMYLEMTASFP